MVEDIEGIEVEAQPDALVQRKFLAERHVEAHPKGTAEQIATGIREVRLIAVAADPRFAGGNAIRSWLHKLRIEVADVYHRLAGIHTRGALERGLARRHAWLQGQDRIGNLDVGSEV